MKFIHENIKERVVTFGDVAQHQFFVSGNVLFQKHDDNARYVADGEGRLIGGVWNNIPDDKRIDRLCHTVTKIEF